MQALIQYSWRPKKRRSGHKDTEERPHEDTEGGRQFTSQEERRSEKYNPANTLILGFWPPEL